MRDASTSPIVLQVIPSFGQGGVEHAAFEMAEALRMHSPAQPTYIASNGGQLLEKSHSFTHLHLPLHSKNPFIIIRNAFRLMHIIRQYSINVVHARSRAPAWSAWLACRITKTSFLTTYHAAYKSKSFIKKFYNSVMVRGQKVIAISNFIHQHIQNYYPAAKSILIYEGIDIDFYTSSPISKNTHSPLNIDREKIIFVPSRLSPIKGIEIALKAFAKVLHEIPCVKLMLIRTGKPHYIQEIDALIQALNLQKHIIFVSPQPDLRDYYEQASLVLVPSLVPEALGRVSLEALSMEKILIASDLGANLEICHPNETGYLVKGGDSNDLANKIFHCLRLDNEEIVRLQKNGRNFVKKHFAKNAMVKSTIQLYQSMR